MRLFVMNPGRNGDACEKTSSTKVRTLGACRAAFEFTRSQRRKSRSPALASLAWKIGIFLVSIFQTGVKVSPELCADVCAWIWTL